MKNIRFLMVALTILISKSSLAVDWTWEGSTSTNWDTKSNWITTSGASRPQSGDDVYIYSGAPNNPTLFNSRTVANVYLYSGTITIQTNNLTTTNLYQYGGTVNTRTNRMNINGTHYIYGGNMVNLQNSSTGDIYVDDVEVNSVTDFTIISSTANLRYNVSNSIDFVTGVFYTSSNDPIRMLNGSTATGGNNVSYVDGPLTKIGNNAFTFIVGKSGVYAPIAMTVPTTSSTYVGEYFPTPYVDTTSLGSGIDHVSKVEYWTLNRTAGTGSVQVTLFNDLSRSGPIDNMANIVVARYNSGTSQWVNHGNGGITGTNVSGSVTSSVAVGNFSPFTLASTNGLNPLPVSLIAFEAQLTNSIVEIEWSVSNENACEHYTVEKSLDGINWIEISKVDAMNSGSNIEKYSSIDPNPIKGVQFYRLCQKDIEGESKVISKTVLNFSNSKAPIKIYPNPAHSNVVLELNPADLDNVKINLVNNIGLVVKTISNVSELNDIDVSDLPTGIYTLEVNSNGILSYHTLSIQ